MRVGPLSARTQVVFPMFLFANMGSWYSNVRRNDPKTKPSSLAIHMMHPAVCSRAGKVFGHKLQMSGGPLSMYLPGVEHDSCMFILCQDRAAGLSQQSNPSLDPKIRSNEA